MSARDSKKWAKKMQFRWRKDWDGIKLGVMEEVLRIKFSDKELRQKLVDTFPHDLYEGNYWGDKFWGCDYDLNGENHLGKILMKIRFEHVMGGNDDDDGRN